MGGSCDGRGHGEKEEEQAQCKCDIRSVSLRRPFERESPEEPDQYS